VPVIDEPLMQAKGALFFGFEVIRPDGERHPELKVLRGNGNLVLTRTELRFTRWLPRTEFVIPLDRVKWTAVAKSHNRKWMWRRPVLQA
jgi:hypothetical protein